MSTLTHTPISISSRPLSPQPMLFFHLRMEEDEDKDIHLQLLQLPPN